MPRKSSTEEGILIDADSVNDEAKEASANRLRSRSSSSSLLGIGDGLKEREREAFKIKDGLRRLLKNLFQNFGREEVESFA